MKTIIFVLLLVMSLSSCHEVAPGFLKAEGAHYRVDSLVVKATLDPVLDRDRIEKRLAWESEEIEGVLGTPQVRYEIADVRPDEGNVGDGNAGEQVKMLGKGKVRMECDHTVSEGIYWVDVLIYNEGHRLVKKSLLKLIVK